MSRYSNVDRYVDAASGVLRNRLRIDDAGLLQQVEADLAAARSRELALLPLKGNFDLGHLQAIHRYLFGDLYEWAGRLRTVDISKNGRLFAHHAHLASACALLFDELAREKRLTGLDVESFALRSAYYFSEINALHPFQEGNGRTQREFLSHLAHRNVLRFAWEEVDPDELLQGSIESFGGNLLRLSAIFRSIVQTVRS